MSHLNGILTPLQEHPSVTLFRDYLRIKTVQPNPDYKGAALFLKDLSEKYGFEYDTYECVEGKPIVIMTWRGQDESLPSILLNSHIDVVPVEEAKWDHDPFSAYKNENGDIFARGSQDMKCVSIQHIEACYALKQRGFKPLRTIHISLVPDEEVGGVEGMELFVETDRFKQLNVGFALDEGLASPNDVFSVYYGERSAWWVKLKAIGPTGHGSQLFPSTATDNMMKFLNHFVEWRNEELRKLTEDKLDIGEVTSININMFKSGKFSPDYSTFQPNIIPSEAEASIDIRCAPSVNLEDLDARVNKWAQENNITVSYLQKLDKHYITPLDGNVWWEIFQEVCDAMDFKIHKRIFPAGTDSRFLRRKGIPAIGFSPMNNTPILLHDHNEYLNEKIFLKGIDFFVALVEKLASNK